MRKSIKVEHMSNNAKTKTYKEPRVRYAMLHAYKAFGELPVPKAISITSPTYNTIALVLHKTPVPLCDTG